MKTLMSGIYLLCFISLASCSNDSLVPKLSITEDTQDYSLVFSMGDGDPCFYPRMSFSGRYLAIEREQTVYPPGYVAHIWIYDMSSEQARQLTGNPAEGYNDDRNLRFTNDDSIIYFLRILWHLDGSYERSLCRMQVDGGEEDVERLPDGGMTIYRFDLLPDNSTLLIAYYDHGLLEYKTGFLDPETGGITPLVHMAGLKHNSLVPLPDGSGFIASTGASGSDLFSYKLLRHNFNGQPSTQYTSPPLRYLVWVLSINPGEDRLLVHQGICNASSTQSVPLSGGQPKQLLTKYTLARDACWGPDDYIYFTAYGSVMRYGPFH